MRSDADFCEDCNGMSDLCLSTECNHPNRVSSTMNNIVKFRLPISIPESERTNIFKWLNFAHTGREVIGCDEDLSQDHQDAAYNLCAGRTLEVSVAVDSKGNWQLLEAKLV